MYELKVKVTGDKPASYLDLINDLKEKQAEVDAFCIETEKAYSKVGMEKWKAVKKQLQPFFEATAALWEFLTIVNDRQEKLQITPHGELCWDMGNYHLNFEIDERNPGKLLKLMEIWTNETDLFAAALKDLIKTKYAALEARAATAQAKYDAMVASAAAIETTETTETAETTN